MDIYQFLLELLRGFLLPTAAAFVTSLITIFGFERYKSGKAYKTLLENLQREMFLAQFVHPINRSGARHITGGFISYPVEIVGRLLFDPSLGEKLPRAFLEALQAYLQEALRLNALIETTKLLIGAGRQLGSQGISSLALDELRKAVDTQSSVEGLITKVQDAIPRSGITSSIGWRGRSEADNG